MNGHHPKRVIGRVIETKQNLGRFTECMGIFIKLLLSQYSSIIILNKHTLRGNVESGVRPAGGAFIHWGNSIEAADDGPAAFLFAVGYIRAINHLSVREVT